MTMVVVYLDLNAGGMWVRLTSLRKLNLRNDWVMTLQSGTFSNLPSLNPLNLSENTPLGLPTHGLKTLDSNIFGPDGHPRKLFLDMVKMNWTVMQHCAG